ncbi:MAG: IS5 family transposase, partial [Gammaproteobacteria bacterium]|nr:IS5 family transposase [Gammaproteobacteria bacterium]
FIFRYRVPNWPEYNRALIARGSLTLWVYEQAVSTWRQRRGPRGRGRPRIYSDTAIECALVVRSVFHLSLRATQGFLDSVVRLMGVDLPVPAYSTLSRRQAGLELRLRPAPARQPRHIVIDTTGLKVFGVGEWYVRKHGAGKGKRRTWRKLHLCVDETTKDIVAVDLTASGVHDSPHLPAVLDRVEGDVGQVSGDRAYDSGTCYEAILARGAVPTIQPRRNARFSRAKDPPRYRVERDAVLRRIRDEGRYP